jgi:hypothetical protein
VTRETKAEREERERLEREAAEAADLEARRERALEQAQAIALQAIYGADGAEYAVDDAPLADLEAVLARKARRRR